MLFDASPFTGTTALYALIAVVVLVALFALLGRGGKFKLPFFEASTNQAAKVKVAEGLQVKPQGKVGNITGAKTKGEGPQQADVANNAVIEGQAGDITGTIEE